MGLSIGRSSLSSRRTAVARRNADPGLTFYLLVRRRATRGAEPIAS